MVFAWKQAVSVLAANVVDGIALTLFRLQMIGIRHIMVASLVPGTCMPYSTMWANNSNACITNDTMSSETILNNALLEDRVKLLNKGLHGANIIIVNMTKAFQELFHNGEKYGEMAFTKIFDVCHLNFKYHMIYFKFSVTYHVLLFIGKAYHGTFTTLALIKLFIGTIDFFGNCIFKI